MFVPLTRGSRRRQASRVAGVTDNTSPHRAEDLLRTPDITLRRVCEWLELPCDDGIVARMRHPEDWCFADNGPDGNLLGADYKFMTDPALRQIPEPGPVVFDPAWGMHPELVGQMTQVARFLGY